MFEDAFWLLGGLKLVGRVVLMPTVIIKENNSGGLDEDGDKGEISVFERFSEGKLTTSLVMSR